MDDGDDGRYDDLVSARHGDDYLDDEDLMVENISVVPNGKRPVLDDDSAV